MKKMKKKILSILLVVTFFIGIMPMAAFADGADVVSFGADISTAQQDQLLKIFGVTRDQVEIIEVTNQDERNLLQGVATEQQIGTRAISSAYVGLLDEGSGIQVETHNITVM